MDVNVKLGASDLARHGGRVPLPLEEGEAVRLCLSSSAYSLGTLAVHARCGTEEKKYKTTSGTVDITELCRAAGAVEVSVSLIAGGEAVKTWQLEPIVLKELDGRLTAIPELEKMRGAIALMQRAISEMNEKIEKINEM